MYQAEHYYERSWVYQDYRIIQCETCGYNHIDPIPTQEEIEQFYRDNYHETVKKFPYEQITAEIIAQHQEWLKSNRLYIEAYEKVMDLKKTVSLKMIDLGCGNNLLVKFFQNYGWQVTAIEPSPSARKYLQKFGVEALDGTAETVDSLSLGNLSFVNIDFVLEHLRNPGEALRKVYGLMETGGVLRVSVPNDFSEGQLAYKEKFKVDPRWVCLPDHINYFTFDSLHNLLAKAGFKEVYRTTVFPLEFLLMGGINYYASDEEHKKVHPFVTNFEASFTETGRGELLKKLYENLAQLGFGRSIYMYAIKE